MFAVWNSKMKKMEFKSNYMHKRYHIEKCISCDITHVTYILKFPCGLQYLERTTGRLLVQISEHINNIRKGYKKQCLQPLQVVS